MAQNFSQRFYKSKAWHSCRDSYMSYIGGLCERCLSKGLYTPAYIVHHKIYINEDNIQEPSITLNWDNLEALCLECHNDEHMKSEAKRRYNVNSDGTITM